MKLSKTLALSAAVTALTAAATFAPVASAAPEVSGSVGVANMYLWRGYDLGYGDAAVSGDLSVSAAGFYGGVWGSSGDATYGTEYDLYAGWGGEFGDWFSVDISAWTYVYPSGVSDNLGDLSEAILSLGFGPVAVTYYENIAGAPEYSYITVGGTIGSFSALVGRHMTDEDGDEPTHLDLSYAYNDNLSFTVSKFIADDENVDKSAKFVVSYSLPIE